MADLQTVIGLLYRLYATQCHIVPVRQRAALLAVAARLSSNFPPVPHATSVRTGAVERSERWQRAYRRPGPGPPYRRAVGKYTHAAGRDASRLADHALHQAIARAAHNARLVDLSARIRREVGLGFDAEPYTPKMGRRCSATACRRWPSDGRGGPSRCGR
jgi:hypothetical protein